MRQSIPRTGVLTHVQRSSMVDFSGAQVIVYHGFQPIRSIADQAQYGVDFISWVCHFETSSGSQYVDEGRRRVGRLRDLSNLLDLDEIHLMRIHSWGLRANSEEKSIIFPEKLH